jgi:WhiB family redox-sensing transcriptional regulator
MSAVVVPFPARDQGELDTPLCAARDQDWWFDPGQYDAAIRICHRCRIRERCLDQALRSGERLGVWGGLTPEQRDALPDATVVAFPRRPTIAP